jgi:hypothetical protein
MLLSLHPNHGCRLTTNVYITTLKNKCFTIFNSTCVYFLSILSHYSNAHIHLDLTFPFSFPFKEGHGEHKILVCQFV